MWYCQLCHVTFASESIEQHVYTNHLKPNIDRIKPYKCGECMLTAEGFEDIALHCINFGHEPTRVIKGENYDMYVPQLLSALQEMMCMKTSSPLETKQTNRSLGITIDLETDGKAVDWSQSDQWTQSMESVRNKGSGLRKGEELVGTDDGDTTEIETDDNEPWESDELELTKKSSEISFEGPTPLSTTPVNSANFTNAISGTDQRDTDAPKRNQIENEQNKTTIQPIKQPSSIRLSSDGQKPVSRTKGQKLFDDAWKAKRRHQRIHTGDKPCWCKTSKSSFSRSDHLARHHTLVHTPSVLQPHKSDLYSCSFCEKEFKQKYNLQLHERIHTGERPFSCSKCGKSFAGIGNLQRHERIHSGERPYSCTICTKSFTQLVHLQLHKRRIHSGENPSHDTKN